MKTIKQLSRDLKISKEAVYKKLKYQLKESLEGHITKLNNVTYVDDIGEQIIIQSLSLERQEAINGIINSDITDDNGTIDNNQLHVTEYINLLQEQIKTKDIQIVTQNNHISQLISQLGNKEFLIHAQQYRNILYLQTEAVALKETQYKTEPFWKRIFKR